MYIELTPVLLTLIALLVALLATAFVRWASVKGWLLLGVLVLACAGTRPNKADHVTVVRQAAGAQLVREASSANAVGHLADLRSGKFDALAVYKNWGLASIVVIHGKVVSFGVLGKVLVMGTYPLAGSSQSLHRVGAIEQRPRSAGEQRGDRERRQERERTDPDHARLVP